MYRRIHVTHAVLFAIGAAALCGPLAAQEHPTAEAALRHAELTLSELDGRLEGLGGHLELVRGRLEGELAGVEMALGATQARLEHFESVALEGVERHLALTEATLKRMSGVVARSGAVSASDRGLERSPPASWLQGDPGDSLYRLGREALNGGDYRRAASLFERLRQRHPRSGHVPDSYYWEAFARNRIGGTDQLRQALALLETQAERYADANTARDGRVLAMRIRGALAQRGDAAAAEAIVSRAAPPAPPAQAAPPAHAAPPAPPAHGGVIQHADEEDDIRVIALMALLQMDAERAIPMLRDVMARRDPGSVALRRRAVFIISQKRSEETTDLLLDAVRNDPDPEVRQQAVFFLSQVRDERAVDVLADILETTDDPEVQQAAVFALSQHRSERAGQALRGYAEREDVSDEIRGAAVFGLSQHRSPENQAFLRQLYGRVRDPDVKAQILHAVSQSDDEAAQRWMLEIALDRTEDLEARKQALFWAGQNRELPIASLTDLYSSTDDLEIRQQVLFVLSQRREPGAVDKLMDIARNDPNEELRRQAIFWLGQSRDPRVAEFLLEIINR